MCISLINILRNTEKRSTVQEKLLCFLFELHLLFMLIYINATVLIEIIEHSEKICTRKLSRRLNKMQFNFADTQNRVEKVCKKSYYTNTLMLHLT